VQHRGARLEGVHLREDLADAGEVGGVVALARPELRERQSQQA
jgi:hypothetical protein